MRRRRWGLALRRSCCVAALILAACVGPARSEADYRADVSNTARMATSSVESALLTVRAVVEDKAASPYVARRLTEDEQGLDATVTSFASVQPPTRDMDAVRSEVLALLNEAGGVLADLRIAAFRDDHGRLAEIARPLPGLADDLSRYEHVAGG